MQLSHRANALPGFRNGIYPGEKSDVEREGGSGDVVAFFIFFSLVYLG